MKTILQLIIVSLTFLSACTRDNNNVVPSNALTSVITQNRWVVTGFTQDGNDRSFLFGGYRFTFGSNFSVLAVKGNNAAAANGTWSSGAINGRSTLLLDFGSAQDFERLNGNWETVELTSSFFRLQRGAIGGDLLNFEVN
jgi:hypothetical protein